MDQAEERHAHPEEIDPFLALGDLYIQMQHDCKYMKFFPARGSRSMVDFSIGFREHLIIFVPSPS